MPNLIKTKQINVRVTPDQEQAIKKHCIRNGVTTQAAVIAALERMITDFPKAGATDDSIVGFDELLRLE